VNIDSEEVKEHLTSKLDKTYEITKQEPINSSIVTNGSKMKVNFEKTQTRVA
jgi:hypothetical protein